MIRVQSAIAVTALAGLSSYAQTPSTPAAFEVASIKRAPEGQGFFLQISPAGDLRATGVTLKNLMAMAYNVREFQVSGPEWVNSERFDVNARVDRSTAGSSRATESRECVQTLLTQRFQLKIHRESKEQSVYSLVVAKNGPKLHEPQSGQPSGIRGRKGSIVGHGTAMRMLALNLSNQLGRPVLDQTGLTATYDFQLEWTPDSSPSDASAANPPLVSLFAALQEQLGLRLETQKAPVEVVVIDRAERPSEN